MTRLHRRSRRVLRVALAVVTASVLVAGVVFWRIYDSAPIDTSGQHEFASRLAIPPLLEGKVDEGGRRVFDLHVMAGTSELVPGKPTETWGVNGTYLGPTIRAAVGEEVVLNVENRLPEATTMHWHGMHLPAVADGGPHQPIEPGETWSPSWVVDQPAATLWYHPHQMGLTADHVYRGLAGLFILDDPAAAAPLPHEYGVDDIPVIVQDKRLNSDGSLDFSDPSFSFTGIHGPTVLVNGTTDPFMEVTTERVRLRLLNASNARIYNFGFADGRKFELIGTDSGLVAEPAALDRIQLSPGERAEIVVEMKPGEEAVLRSFPPELGTSFFTERFNGGLDTLDVMALRAMDRLDPSPQVPDRLADIPALTKEDADRVRPFELGGVEINDRQMDMGRIDHVVTVDTIEVWELTNRSGFPHSFHVHDIHFQILDVDGNEPPPHLSGWKDTVYVPPDGHVQIIGRFADYTDPSNPYMFHCHILQHEDLGMMGQFVVTESGESVSPELSTDANPRRHNH